ncbi:HAD family hydrolase [Sphingoaurantiacus capsulatus]|uniref:Phosphoglycolate phosphatase n=1 Tax=Sphingoaurantiacus capsulatus TaxID=1771310 RepID=A0ABV7XBC1_9SPHN
MTNTLPRLVIFDLDGTLVDTGPDLTAALNHALGVLGRREVDEESVKEMVGLGARKLLERGLEATGVMTDELIDAGVQPFLDYYAANICVGSKPYPGLEAAMDELAADGVTLAVCTNKPQRLSELLIEALGWQGRFAAILGADRVPQRKPHPSHVLSTIEAAGGDVRSTAFIGDSIVDVTAAKAADVPVIAVSFGFPDRPADTLGADAVIDSYAELIPALRRLAASATW